MKTLAVFIIINLVLFNVPYAAEQSLANHNNIIVYSGNNSDNAYAGVKSVSGGNILEQSLNSNKNNVDTGNGGRGTNINSVLANNSSFDVSYDTQTRKVTIIDPINHAIIMDPTAATQRVYDRSWDFAQNETPAPANQINFTAQPNGYDIEIRVRNDGTDAARVGTIFADGIKFTQTSQYRDFTYFGLGDNLATATPNHEGNWFPHMRLYPSGDAYSPVLYVQGYIPGQDGTPAEYGIGISLQYPVLEYGQTATAWQSVYGIWRVAFYNNPKWKSTTGGPCVPGDPQCRLSSWYIPEDDLQPSEQRIYRYSVRVMRNPSSYPPLPYEWLRTLEPYREYFQKTYGLPRYAVDHRPIEGIIASQQEHVTQNNPGGFAQPRLDINGWGPLVDDIRRQSDVDGWPRQILWATNGMNPVANYSTNYRYEFTSHWQQIPAMASTQNIIADYGKNHPTLGLWWGNSGTVFVNGWDHEESELFDQTNPSHRSKAFTELAGAHAVGAKIIGLDTYIVPSYKGYAWLNEMKIRNPGVLFAGESFRSDIIHLLAANFKLLGQIPQTTDHTECTDGRPLIRPLALPDFILHHHETWGHSWVGWINENACNNRSWDLNTQEMNYWPQYVASQGFVPLIGLWMGANQHLDVNAVMQSYQPGYMTTVPADLQTPYAPELQTQPSSTSAACNTNTTLSASVTSDANNIAVTYRWYFRPLSLDPENDELPEDLINGFMQPVQDSTVYSGSTNNMLTVKVTPATIGTYAMAVTGPNGATTWSDYVSLSDAPNISNGSCTLNSTNNNNDGGNADARHHKKKRGFWRRIFGFL